jgi:hemolysin III
MYNQFGMAELEISERGQTVSEEIANSISHGIGLALAITATPFLIVTAARGKVWNVVGVSVFATSVMLLYLASTLYHAIPHDRAKKVFRVLDHGAIFLLIAGTYTPFTFGVMRGPWGWTLFGLIWSMAVFGLTTKAIFGAQQRWLTVPLYLAMGWLAVIAAPQILFRLPLPALIWLLAGGFAYTAGIICFKAHAIRYSHFAWHLFVIAGSVCHFFAVLWYSS